MHIYIYIYIYIYTWGLGFSFFLDVGFGFSVFCHQLGVYILDRGSLRGCLSSSIP